MARSEGPQSILSLPNGGGALHGMGEKFSPDLHAGTGKATVPIVLPTGRNGFQPDLNLEYSTGHGNGLFGLGWSLGIPGVTRKSAQGIPQYRDALAGADERDKFLLSGVEDLVFLGMATDETGTSAEKYRPRTEGLFAEIHRYRNLARGTDFWRMRTRDGRTSYYGTHPASSERPRYPPGTPDAGDRANLAKPDRATDIFAWRLTLTRDPFGNRIEYLYDFDEGSQVGHQWKQPLLKRIRYGDYGNRDEPAFLVTLTFEYEMRPDPFSDYRSAFEIRTTRRCRAILIETHAGAARPVRRYEFAYRQDALTRVSLLRAIEVVGFDDDGGEARELPPLEFGYTNFDPQNARRRDFYPLQGFDLPAASLASPSLELVDLFGRGMPDIVEMSSTVRFWRNRGGGRFGVPDQMTEAPPERLGEPGVQLVDANGDGRGDLLVTRRPLSGYYPLQFGGLWDRSSFRRYAYAPSFDLKDPEVRLVDLTGDGVTDAICSGSRLECFFNDPRDGWRPDRVRWYERAPLEEFPNVNFSDPRVKWADLSGDGMQDIALVYDGNVEYWPNLGYGRWGRRLHMCNSPRFPLGYDPRRILLGDVNGDGLADLLYIEDRRTLLWINQSGNSWSDPIEIRGTPPVSDLDSLRLADLLGSGISGVLWTQNARLDSEDHYFFLDLTGGQKPYLLDEFNNNIGAITRIAYASSTRFCLEDEQPGGMRWKTTLPFPVQVVTQVEVIDEISRAKLVTEYRYHHGYWDGSEREFRGFGMVEQRDTESFERYREPGLHGSDTAFAQVPQQYFSAPTLTRTWFHQGAVGDDASNWRQLEPGEEYWPFDAPFLGHFEVIDTALTELDQRYAGLTSRERHEIRRDALRSLRGSVLRTELYALDGGASEDRPCTVTEFAYGLREEEVPAGPTDRQHVFFPHPIARRTTQWERGDDPMTSLLYTRDYDSFGNPCTRIEIGCPRGWRRPEDGVFDASYLATLTRTTLASPADGETYIHDRVARTSSYEIVNPPIPRAPANVPGRTLAQVLDLALAPDNLRLFSESIRFYDADLLQPGNGAFLGLPFGVVGRFGAVTRSESLVLREAILDAAYGAERPPYLVPGQPFAANGQYPAGFVAHVGTLAGYVYHAPGGVYSGGWYVPSGRTRFDYHGSGTPRGLALAHLDPFDAETLIEYDQPYAMLPTAVTNAVGMTTRAVYNYRVLQPQLVTDANGNRARADFSPIGLVASTWAMGKANQNAGDAARPSTVLDYDLTAFIRGKQQDPARPRPVFVRTLRYTHHDTDPDDAGEAIESREYSDGFGRVTQIRSQAESLRFGDAIFGGGSTVLPASQSDRRGGEVQGVANTDPLNPNVIVSGAQRYDNKGNVVEKYEPYFSTGWEYAPPRDGPDAARRDFGARVSTFYDALGRPILTLNPDGSQHRVVYGIPRSLDVDPGDPAQIIPSAWETYTYDANDNAGRTDPGAAGDYAHHWNTPSSVEVDALGRIVVATARNRAAPANSGAAMPPVEEYRTRSTYDIQGNLVELIDPLNRPAFACVYDLARRALRMDSIDAGGRTLVLDARGQEVERSDSKGARVLRSYDRLGRADRQWASNDGAQSVTLRESMFYGDGGDPNQAVNERNLARDSNLLGKPARQLDEAGEVTFAAYDFKGNVLDKVRAVIADNDLIAALDGAGDPARAFVVDWDDAPALEGAYQTSLTYDALDRIKTIRYPRDVDGVHKILAPRYNRAGALEHVELDGHVFVDRIAYDAKGQRVLITFGNGLMTRYAYDPNTFRLARMRTEPFMSTAAVTYRPRGTALLDCAYTYDFAGNVTRIIELTPGCGVRNNPEAARYAELQALMGAGDALVRRFTYDPLYRLIFATGREANSIPGTERPWEDVSGDGFNWNGIGTTRPENARDRARLYTERYDYDAADNLVRLNHGTWSRYFGISGYTPQTWAQEWRSHLDLSAPWRPGVSNRLTHVGDDRPNVAQTHFFDGNGNLIRQNTERHFAWDAADRMIGFANRVGNSNATLEACYLYDASGQRVKKLVRTSAGVETTVYIDGTFERVTAGTTRNDTLHVMDASRRIARVRRRVGPALRGDTGPDVQFDLRDTRGTVSVVVGGVDAAASEFVNREEFSPFGETNFGSFGRKRYRYAGCERDESGLYCHSRRYYAPWLCRWVSTDPAGTVEGGNVYVYSRNSPITRSDPSGLQSGGVAVESDAGQPNTPDATGTSDAGMQFSYVEVAGATPSPTAATITSGEPEERKRTGKHSASFSLGTFKVDPELSQSIKGYASHRDDVLTPRKESAKGNDWDTVTTKRGVKTETSGPSVSWTAISGSISANKANYESYFNDSHRGSWYRTSEGTFKYSFFSFGLSTDGLNVTVGQASYTTFSTEVGGNYGDWLGGFTWDLTETGPSLKATAGISDGEAKVSLGATLASYQGSVGMDMLGLNISVVGEFNVGTKLGFEIGARTMVHAAVAGIGVDVGAAKSVEPEGGWSGLAGNVYKHWLKPLIPQPPGWRAPHPFIGR
jgi:RHS repeat-associated protein